MNDTIKKLILFGVGSLELTKEAANKFLQDLEKQGALDNSEGKKVVKQTLKEIDKNLKSFEKEVNKGIAKWEKERKHQQKANERTTHPEKKPTKAKKRTVAKSKSK